MEVPQKKLNDLTLVELKAIAKEKNIEKYSTKAKVN